jgi:hypothetical protein
LQKQWWGGFQGEFTIVNEGTSPINGWQLSAVLSGDTVWSAWDALFQVNGDTMVMSPPSFQQTIAPGATVNEYFTASGPSTSPPSCTFNGSAC